MHNKSGASDPAPLPCAPLAGRIESKVLCDGSPIGEPLGAEQKVLTSELMQDLAAVALEIEGPYSSLYLGDRRAPDGGQWPLAYLNSYGFTIAAGSNEIQRNILGERVLGMAKSK